jgi:hypothetical protein
MIGDAADMTVVEARRGDENAVNHVLVRWSHRQHALRRGLRRGVVCTVVRECNRPPFPGMPALVCPPLPLLLFASAFAPPYCCCCGCCSCSWLRRVLSAQSAVFEGGREQRNSDAQHRGERKETGRTQQTGCVCDCWVRSM